MNIIVLGYIVRGPLGGLAWHHLQYVIGLSNLGHNVFYFEDSDDYPSCYDPGRNLIGTNPDYGIGFASGTFERTGFNDKWVYHDAHTGRWLGPAAEKWQAICESADLVLNISGINPLRSWFLDIPERVLIDTDPAFTQIRHLSDQIARQEAAKHTAFFSFGENVFTESCSIPSDGFPWRPTRQPIVLGQWPVMPGPDDGAFTTVMQWDSYKPVQYMGTLYDMKSGSFTPFMDLPRLTESRLELCLGSSSAPRSLLRQKGWLLSDPLEITRDPWSYQRYIQSSKGEFTIAKHGYVVSHSGWFSERSAAYLASARPVVTQETGFSEWLDTGSGILAFNTLDEAVDSLAEVNSNYAYHSRAARETAEKYFDSRIVLQNLLDELF
jgi:hypothetical protein